MYDMYGTPTVMPFDLPRGINPLGGRTFYVRNGGDDDNEGTDPQFPLATVAVAYGKVTTAMNDYIFVSNYYTATTSATSLAKADFHIIGLGTGSFDSGVHLPGTSEASLTLATNCRDLELAGFSIGNDATAVCIDTTGQCSRIHIHHCALGWNYGATDGIAFTAGGALLYPTIDHNYFGYQTSGVGISAYLNSGMIGHNIFHCCGTNGIYCTSGGFNVSIFENQFYDDQDDTPGLGWAIKLDANTYDYMVMHNFASETGDNTGNVPYSDLTGSSDADMKNGWSMNYHGEAIAVISTS